MTPAQYLEFKKSESDQEIKDIFNFNAKAFAESQDFTWSEDNIKKEIKEGWKLYSVSYDDDIVAALFLKKDDGTLLTKNTPIKLIYQGNGFSHKIKDFYEKVAKENSMKRIVNYCPSDNFRMISLNEGHDYTKTGKTFGPHDEILEWEKHLKN
ncbi:MAG: hypothetical protein KC478_03160 [Bacteriovoracaceae bacterium]|nr:hypothetical protein [Bacteriovoracaceae bacterium]